MPIKYQVKRANSAIWSSVNPTLDSGEFGFETNTNKLKIGTGSNTWNTLSYIAGGILNFDTVAAVTSSTISNGTSHIRTSGYYSAGDGGGAIYRKISTPAPVKKQHIQSADGQYWELENYSSINVLQLGAYRDNSNAAPNVAATLSAFQDAAGFSKSVYIPEGTYFLNGTITVSLNGSTFYGDGWDSTVISSNSVSTPIFSINAGLNGINLEKMKLTRPRDGSGQPLVSDGGRGIDCGLKSIGQSRFSDLIIENQYDGMYLGSTDYSIISNVILQRNKRHGIIWVNGQYMALQWQLNNVLAQFNDGNGLYIFPVAGPSEQVSFANSATGGHIVGTHATDLTEGLNEAYVRVKFTTTGSLPTGLSTGTDYYVRRQSATTSKYANSAVNAAANNFIPWAGTGNTGTHTYYSQNLPAQLTLGQWNRVSTYGNNLYGAIFLGLDTGNVNIPCQGIRLFESFFGDDGEGGVYLDTKGGNQHIIADTFMELSGTGVTGSNAFSAFGGTVTAATGRGSGLVISNTNKTTQISGCHAFGNSLDGYYLAGEEHYVVNCRGVNNGGNTSGPTRNGLTLAEGRANIVGGRYGNTPDYNGQVHGISVANGANVIVSGVDLTGPGTPSGNSLNCVTNVDQLTAIGNFPASLPTRMPFKQTGTGATNRTVDSKLKDGWISVTDFGADPTGATDSTTAIHNAIAAVNAAGGGVVYFPAGTYATTTGITLGNGTNDSPSTKDNRVRLVGASYGSSTGVTNQQVNGSSRILFTGTASTTAAVVQLAGPMHSVGIENLTLDCDSKAGYGLLCIHVTQATFHRVSARNYTNVGYLLTTRTKNPEGCAFGNADNRFTDCYGFLDAFSTNDIRAIVLHTGINNEPVAFSNSEGHILGTYATDIENLAEVQFYTDGTLPSGLSTGTSYYVIRQSATTAKYANTYANAVAKANIAYSTAGSGTHGYAKMLNGQPDSARNVFIGGTYFYNHTAESHGVWLSGADNNALFEVQFLPAGQSGNVIFSNSGGHILGTNTNDYADLSEVRFTTSNTLPTGLTTGISYWTRLQSANTAKFATSRALASSNTFISYTDAGIGDHKYTIRAQGHDVYFQQWSVGGGLFPLENYFCNLGMTRGVGGNGGVGSSWGNLFVPFPTSDGGEGLTTVTGMSAMTHQGQTYIAGKRALSTRQLITLSSTTSRNTTSGTYVDIPGYNVAVTTLAESNLRVSFTGSGSKSTANIGYFVITINGADQTATERQVLANTGNNSISMHTVVAVGSGTQTANIKFKTSDAAAVTMDRGVLTVEELY